MSITQNKSKNRKKKNRISTVLSMLKCMLWGQDICRRKLPGIADSLRTKVADGCSAVRRGQDEVAIYFCSFWQVSALTSIEDKPTIRSDRVPCLASSGNLTFLYNFSSWLMTRCSFPSHGVTARCVATFIALLFRSSEIQNSYYISYYKFER